MSKNSIIAVLVALVGLMAITLMVVSIKDGSKPPSDPVEGDTPNEGIEAGSGNESKPATPKPTWGKTSITGGAVDALPGKRVITNDFVTSGQGYYAKWGRGLKAGFRQHGIFVAEAEVVERKKLGNGRFKVVEDRKFLTARETLEISSADYFLALDTLPIDEIASALDTVGKAASAVSGFLVSTAQPVLVKAGAVTKTIGGGAGIVAAGFRHFKLSNNGKTIKDFGIDVTEKAKQAVESKINDFTRSPKEIEAIVRKVEGRTYRFTYIQEGTGKPLNVTAERKDEKGNLTPLETEEEVWILCKCNAFIDAEFLKDGGEKTPPPGGKWEVDARSVAGIVGADGYCNGRLTCCRVDAGTDSGGLWEFVINPAELDVVDDSGRKLGKISVGGGKSTVYADGRTLRDVTIKGLGKLNRVNKNSILFLPFNEKFIGDCHFAGKMTTGIK